MAEYAESGELVDLLVGSEGTLCVIRRRRARPRARFPARPRACSRSYASLEAAVIGAGQAQRGGASACELLDSTFLDVAARSVAAPDSRRTPRRCS